MAEGHFHSEEAYELLLHLVVVGAVLDDAAYAVVEHVGDVHAEALAHEGVAAFLVDHGALLVHHVVVFEQALTHSEVVLFDLLLCTLDAVVDHRVLDHLAVLEAEAVHDLGDALAGEQAHELVLERDEEDAGARVALAA